MGSGSSGSPSKSSRSRISTTSRYNRSLKRGTATSTGTDLIPRMPRAFALTVRGGRRVPVSKPLAMVADSAAVSGLQGSLTRPFASGAGGARTHDPGIMSESEPALTRTYCTLVARRALLERIQCGLVPISAHTPACMGRPSRASSTHIVQMKLPSGKGRRCHLTTARGPGGRPRSTSSSSPDRRTLTQGNEHQNATQAQSVPAFQRGGYDKISRTRFRTTISMQYPWVEEDPQGYGVEGGGYPPDRRCRRAHDLARRSADLTGCSRG